MLDDDYDDKLVRMAMTRSVKSSRAAVATTLFNNHLYRWLLKTYLKPSSSLFVISCKSLMDCCS